MINKPTVFILGAGASIPYGYPSGETLVTETVSELSQRGLLFKLCRELGFNQLEISKFAETLNLSGDKSIDAFLERNPQFIKLGKIAITLKLIEKEDENRLFSPGNDKWYGDLVNELKSSSTDTFVNNVSFLTFNYDRSFDHYLFVSIMNSYEEIKGDIQCAQIVSRIPIIHLHGHIGKLFWQESNGIERPYANSFGSLDLLKRATATSAADFGGLELSGARHFISDISDQIRIIHEKDQ